MSEFNFKIEIPDNLLKAFGSEAIRDYLEEQIRILAQTVGEGYQVVDQELANDLDQELADAIMRFQEDSMQRGVDQMLSPSLIDKKEK